MSKELEKEIDDITTNIGTSQVLDLHIKNIKETDVYLIKDNWILGVDDPSRINYLLKSNELELIGITDYFVVKNRLIDCRTDNEYKLLIFKSYAKDHYREYCGFHINIWSAIKLLKIFYGCGTNTAKELLEWTNKN